MSKTYHIAVIDTETTGLYPTSDRLVEVAVKLLAIDAGAESVNNSETHSPKSLVNHLPVHRDQRRIDPSSRRHLARDWLSIDKSV